MPSARGTPEAREAFTTEPFKYFRGAWGIDSVPKAAAPVPWRLKRQGVSRDATMVDRTVEAVIHRLSRRDITSTWAFGMGIVFGTPDRGWVGGCTSRSRAVGGCRTKHLQFGTSGRLNSTQR